MNRKVSLGVAVTVVILSVALTISATMMLAMRHFSSLVSDVGQRQAMYDYLDEIDTAARGQYTIDEEVLRSALAQGYLDGLNDPYAEYLTAAEYADVQNELAGNSAGFGFDMIVSESNELTVSYVVQNSPAALAGIKAGDVVTAVDEETVTGASYASVQGKLAGAEKLMLTVEQSGIPVSVELIANTYTTVSVEGRIVEENVGYIRIRSFNNLTAMQFKNVYNELTKNGAVYFVFDVRNNHGGSTAAVQEVLGYLLPSGPYVTCVKKNTTETLKASDPYEITAPSVTLVNGNTMGEAELFAGVLRDMSKTRLVGTSTAGKAVLQEYFSIASDKAAVRLSVGTLKLFNSGNTWQDEGLIPDETVDLSYAKLLRFELLTAEEDDQLQAATTLLKSNQLINATTTTTAGTTTEAKTEATE